MLIHKFFHRAKKVTVSEQELKGKRKKKEEKKDESDEKEEKPKERKNADEAESSHAEGCREEKSLVSKRMALVVPFMHVCSHEIVHTVPAHTFPWIFRRKSSSVRKGKFVLKCTWSRCLLMA